MKFGDDWIANVNGDFSGDVLIRNHEKKISVDLPFSVLKCIVAEWVKRERIAALENTEDANKILVPDVHLLDLQKLSRLV